MSHDATDTVKAGLHGSDGGRRHQWSILSVALAGAVVAMLLPTLSIEQQFWIVLVPIGVFGLSHGGADPLILKRLAANRPGRFALVTALYALAALAFVALIWFLPTLALLVFLVLSTWHFGYTDASFLSPQPNQLLLWLSGSLPILGPILGHPAQVSELFGWLIARDSEQVLAILQPAGPVMAVLWLACFGVLAYRHHRSLGGLALAELSLVAIVLVALPPLLAFAFYFCVIHSIRHFLSIAQHGMGRSEIASTLTFLARKATPATLGAIAIAVGVWALIVLLEPSASLLAEGIRVMFWALAALTLPHGLVVKAWWEGSAGGL